MSNDLKKHLEEMGVWVDRSNETARVIEEISRFIAEDRDQWLCSDCLFDGGYDMPEINVCPGMCHRSYCDSCAEKRGYLCSCGEKLPFESKCEKCHSSLIERNHGDVCTKCERLYYFCRKCNQPCEFLGVLSDFPYYAEISQLKRGPDLSENEIANCGFDVEECKEWKYHESQKPTVFFDLAETCIGEASAFRWSCPRCSKRNSEWAKTQCRKVLWTNPD